MAEMQVESESSDDGIELPLAAWRLSASELVDFINQHNQQPIWNRAIEPAEIDLAMAICCEQFEHETRVVRFAVLLLQIKLRIKLFA